MNAPNALLFALLAALTPATAAASPGYDAVVTGVASMVSDPEARRLAAAHGLDLLNVTWEDTGRWQGSSVGPNISDVTIEVVSEDGGWRKLALMPVLRFPNFTDRTADVRLDRIFLRVGNERRHGGVEVVSLRDVLAEPARFLSPVSWWDFPGLVERWRRHGRAAPDGIGVR